jgi:peptidoglycan/LPS O-acetylase OafA/YrhL
VLIKRFNYRPEIDGLRALAVLSVLLYHYEFGCTGGFVGVDIFFVISGYLITSLIWKDLESGRFSFGQFFERRMRRIAPPLIVMTAAVLVAGAFLLLSEDFKSLGKAAAWQAAFGANIHYWRDAGGYFTQAAGEKPLLHTWSLAVEEQFYLIVPFLLWALFKLHSFRARGPVLSLFGVGLVGSFLLSVWGTAHAPIPSFFLLPTRACELMVGSFIAFVPPDSAFLSRRFVNEVLAVLGLGMMVGPVLVYTEQTPFPGTAAMVPCLGAGLFVLASRLHPTVSTGKEGDELTLLGKIFASRVPVFIGLMSYSLYLWHWPLLAFTRYSELEPITLWQRVGLMTASFVCAVLSWHFVETPFRTRRVAGSRAKVMALGAAGLVGTFVMGAAVVLLQGIPQRFSPDVRRYDSAQHDFKMKNLSIKSVRRGELVPLGIADRGSPPAILVWGDSHGMAALPAVNEFLKERQLYGVAATHTSTAPVLEWVARTRHRPNEDSIPFNREVIAYIKQSKIKTVLLVGYWPSYVTFPGFFEALSSTLKELKREGIGVYVLGDVPIHEFDVVRALVNYANKKDALISVQKKQFDSMRAESEAVDRRVASAVRSAGAVYIEVMPSFVDASRTYFDIEKSGVALYKDKQHLTTAGAKSMLLPVLRDSPLLD